MRARVSKTIYCLLVLFIWIYFLMMLAELFEE